LSGRRQALRLSYNIIVTLFNEIKGILNPVFLERNRKMCNVNANPVSLELLRGVNRRSTPAKRVKNKIVFLTTGL